MPARIKGRSGRSWALTTLALTVLVPVQSVQAQERPGWIGVSVDIVATQGVAGATTTVRVADVQIGSPAAVAGLRAGDTLLEVNDLLGPDELRGLASRLRLNVGDTVRVVYRRDGVEREVRLAAAERPAALAPLGPRVAFGSEQDSMVASIVRAMDSLRVRLGGHPEQIERIRIQGTPPSTPSEGTRRMVIVQPRPTPTPGASAAPREPGGAGWVEVSGAFSPLAPYVLGRNRVAGAEVMDLRPELASYFGVQGGVLVVDVPDRTPAASADLRPGDVIVAVAQDPVDSVEGLRVVLARLGGTPAVGPIPFWVVRQGVRIRVDLPR